MTMNGWILSDSKQCLWSYDRNGLSLLTAVEFMAPFVAEKEEWPLEPDVMYWEEWPVAHPSFLLAAIIYNRLDFYKLWSEKTELIGIDSSFVDGTKIIYRSGVIADTAVEPGYTAEFNVTVEADSSLVRYITREIKWNTFE